LARRRSGFFFQEVIQQRERAEQERRRLEEKLLQTQKLESLGVLAGGIAHDFNNLLVGVVGNASLLLLDLPPGSPFRPTAEEIQQAGERAAELVRQLLAYAGKGKVVVERCNASRLVEETVVLLKSVISKKVALEYRLVEDLPEIEADATQMRQIIMNLITNASESIGDDRGVIRISTGVVRADRRYLSKTCLSEDLPEGQYVSLEVADNGCGMDAETRKKIFDPFFSTKVTGRGLGLAAVLGIVRGHRGAIRVESQPRAGTKFCVLFPACEGNGSPSARRSSRPTGALTHEHHGISSRR
jgi:signal transduction histidine kinase